MRTSLPALLLLVVLLGLVVLLVAPFSPFGPGARAPEADLLLSGLPDSAIRSLAISTRRLSDTVFLMILILSIV